jgi:hypothetical protein
MKDEISFHYSKHEKDRNSINEINNELSLMKHDLLIRLTSIADGNS